jgi:hypothetical protein
MSQPTPHPHHVSQLFGPALGGIVHALADRGEQSTAGYEARAHDAWTLVQSFQPRDTIDLMLTGQFISMNELFADTSRDILRGMPDSLKQRARSSAVAMSRLALAQVAEFERRGIQPYRTEAATEQRPAQSVKTPAADPVETPQSAAAGTPVSRPVASPRPTSSEPAEETSWVDEPYQEWLEETPATLADRPTAIAVNDVPRPVLHEAGVSTGASSEFEPSRQPEHPHAEAMASAAD